MWGCLKSGALPSQTGRNPPQRAGKLSDHVPDPQPPDLPGNLLETCVGWVIFDRQLQQTPSLGPLGKAQMGKHGIMGRRAKRFADSHRFLAVVQGAVVLALSVEADSKALLGVDILEVGREDATETVGGLCRLIGGQQANAQQAVQRYALLCILALRIA